MNKKQGSMELNIGNYMTAVDETLNQLNNDRFTERLAAKDASLWGQDEAGVKAINNRLGWIDILDTMHQRTSAIDAFVNEIIGEGFTDAVLMGMGGSSMCPEVSRQIFGTKDRYLKLHVLDSTDPQTLLDIQRKINIASTLFIVATKSGTTVETLSAFRYFYAKTAAIKDNPGMNFIAITDPGTPLTDMSKEYGFRKLFENFENIGGRYSALSYFGLIPAAVIGVDIKLLLDRASVMALNNKSSADCNEGIILGAVMAELTKAGRDKLTLLTSPEIASFGIWAEQLVAESTGKQGKGIVPIEGEKLESILGYGDDRLFVYMRLDGGDNSEVDSLVADLISSNVPLVTINLSDKYDISREYLRWEIATGTACAILGVNAFDEPNVKESKDNTNTLLKEFNEKGALPVITPSLTEDGISLYTDTIADNAASLVKAILNQHNTGDYFAMMAFLPYSDETYGKLQEIRSLIASRYKSATTLGYGPRFLHSTGQLHKGGPNTGIFMQFTADDKVDVAIPGQNFGFSILKQAQAMGDAAALKSKERRFIRIHLGADIEPGLARILDWLK
ncbi:MAG: glucose-6-phosphate isomerase [Armatimonadota bacterium]